MSLTHPDRSSPVPLWSQVLDDLRRRLATGEFGDRFPTDVELVDTYGVSRATVREALRRLQQEGRILRERGRGSTVRAERMAPDIGTLPQLFAALRSTVGEITSVVRRLERTIDPVAAARLACDPSTPLVVLERVRFADGHPIAVDTAWIRADVGSALLGLDFTTGVLADALAATGVRIVDVTERISAELAGPAERRLLDLPLPTAVLVVSTVSSTADGPVEVRDVAFRGDRFAVTAAWSSSGARSFEGEASISGATVDEVVAAAIRAHRTWRDRLVAAIERSAGSAEPVPLDHSTLGRDDRCPLGRWLLDPPAVIADHPALPTVAAAHTAFHAVLGTSIERARTESAAIALEAVATGGEVDRASRRLTRALRSLLSVVPT